MSDIEQQYLMKSQDRNQLFPVGKYKMKAFEFGLGESTNGSEQAAIGLDVLGEDDTPTGHQLAYYGSFANDQAIEISVRALRVLGWEGDDLSAIDAEKDLSKIALGIVAHEEYPVGSGEWRVKVKGLYDPDSSAMLRKPLDDDAKRSLSARVASKLRTLGVQGGKSSGGGLQDDDLDAVFGAKGKKDAPKAKKK